MTHRRPSAGGTTRAVAKSRAAASHIDAAPSRPAREPPAHPAAAAATRVAAAVVAVVETNQDTKAHDAAGATAHDAATRAARLLRPVQTPCETSRTTAPPCPESCSRTGANAARRLCAARRWVTPETEAKGTVSDDRALGKGALWNAGVITKNNDAAATAPAPRHAGARGHVPKSDAANQTHEARQVLHHASRRRSAGTLQMGSANSARTASTRMPRPRHK